VLAVLYLDLDRFKVVNDSLGHRVGDTVLLQMAERLVHHLRPADTLARLGGDEFVIVAEGVVDEQAAMAFATRIAEVGREPFRVGDENFVCTMSIGVACASDSQRSADDLLGETDMALYRAKGRGRDRAEAFDDELRTTENVLLEASNSAMSGLRALRDAGVQVGLDDFGTGYSSLAYLRQFPLDFVKIDRSFISEVERDDSKRAIVAAIIGLAHALHLLVVAEGVETDGQLHIIEELGCDRAQGFLFAASGPPVASTSSCVARRTGLQPGPPDRKGFICRSWAFGGHRRPTGVWCDQVLTCRLVRVGFMSLVEKQPKESPHDRPCAQVSPAQCAPPTVGRVGSAPGCRRWRRRRCTRVTVTTGDGELLGYLTSLPDKARGVLGGPTESARRSRRGKPEDPTALERVLCVAGLLHDTVERLERLVDDLGPVVARCPTYEPTGGYHRWDPEQVTLLLAAESQKLANMAASLITAETLGARTRQGLALITVELLEQVVEVTHAQLEQAGSTRARASGPAGKE